MRIIFTILFLISVAYGQTTYYVANSGSDAADGLTPATAWQTLAKVNSFSFATGDTIKLNDGDTWNERLLPISNVYFNSYGTGTKPTITGFQSVTGFSQSGNIWTKTITASAGLNMVLINGHVAHKGRYPNATYLTYSSKTYSTLTTSLTGTPNYTGAIAVVRTAPWCLDLSTVTSQSGGTLNLSPNLSYNTALQVNGYFLQGLASLVDTTNEYSYNGTTLTIYSTTTPIVQISNIDTLVWISKKSNITFDGIDFTGANVAAIQFDTSTIVTIKNCSFDYTGSVTLSALKSSRLTVTNNTINHSLSNAIFFRQLDWYVAAANQCDSAIITGNTIKNSGYIAGMGVFKRGEGIYAEGLNLGPYIVGNTIDSSGYGGIHAYGKKFVVRNNIISNFCFITDDGGGFYTSIGSPYLDSAYNDGSIVSSNIVFNGIGATAGKTAVAAAHGLYFDIGSRRITVDSNTVYNCAGIGIAMYVSLTVRYNNIYNNTTGVYFGASVDAADSMIFTHNAIYANSSLPLIDASNTGSSLSYFKSMDSNFYYNPYPYNSSGFGNNLINWNGTKYAFSAWQTFSSKDLHSVLIPTELVTNNAIQLLLNTSSAPITYNLVGSWLSNGVSYNSIPLQPINGAIVLKLAYNVFTNSDLRFKKLTQ